MDSVSLTSLKLFGPVFSKEGGLDFLKIAQLLRMFE